MLLFFRFALLASLTLKFTAVASAATAPPIFSSNPTFSPTDPFAGQNVSFGALAYDPNSLPLTYSWNFGDGGTAAGAAVLHAYAAAGTFTALCTVSNGTASIQGSLTVTVAPRYALKIHSLLFKLNYVKAHSDSIVLNGVFDAPAGFSPLGAQLVVNASGAAKTFTINQKGSAKVGKSTCVLALKQRGNSAANFGFAHPLAFTITMKDDGPNEDFRVPLAAAGFTPLTTQARKVSPTDAFLIAGRFNVPDQNVFDWFYDILSAQWDGKEGKGTDDP
jgi:PKD repeat protein